VFTVIEGVVKVLVVVPVAPAKALPPVSAENHEMVPTDAVAPRVIVPARSLELGVVLVMVGLIIGVTGNVLEVPAPQVLEGVTVMVPLFPLVVTVTELFVPPAVCIHPAGKVQLYVVPATFVTLYTCEVPEQGDVLPEIVLGCVGIVIKVDVKLVVNVIPFVNPAIVPVPAVLVMFTDPAAAVARICIPAIVIISSCPVPVVVYVMVICVAEFTNPVAAVMFLPAVNVTVGLTAVLN